MKKIYFLLGAIFCLQNSLSAQILTQTRTCSVTSAGIPTNWLNLDPVNVSSSGDNKFVYSKNIKGTKPSQGAYTGLTTFQNFGFNLPLNASIDKIDVIVRRFKSGNWNVADFWVSLDTRVGNTYCSYGAQMANQNKFSWSNTPTDVVFTQPVQGPTYDLKGRIQSYYQWTPAMINDPLFGLTFDANIYNTNGSGQGAAVYIDYVEIKVYYTIAVTSPRMANSSSGFGHHEIAVSPNPVTSEALLNYEELKGNAMLIITDLTGKEILKSELSAGSDKHSINLVKDPKGIYLVKLIQQNGELAVYKILKE